MNLIGLKIDKLTVIDLVEHTPSGKKWLCQCDCGTKIIKYTSQLRRVQFKNGHTGCRNCERISRSDSAVEHGGCRFGKSRLYRIWKMMRSRCRTAADTSWPWYGAKGISVCNEWSSFVNFREWALSKGYEDNLSIDRLNSKGNYEPDNCEWVTPSENSRRMHEQRRTVTNGL